ncbi:MAG: type I restriction-modification system subunit M N-terminal domain-containing protein [Pseudonocardia sp.]|nr:type I restriction-modification system subunit M N-terminal domain-containing protein [Pseudonocardia sp.]
MITGELKSKIDRVWDAFWTGGISNPLEVIEQITYLLFLRRLDDEQTRKDKQARYNGGVIVDPIFESGQARLRWSRFKDDDAESMYETVSDEVFPYLLGRRGGLPAAGGPGLLHA